jgi:DNA-binding Lrp family transcriptional regulator
MGLACGRDQPRASSSKRQIITGISPTQRQLQAPGINPLSLEDIDETDREILDLLMRDASRSIAELTRVLGMPRPMVQYRVQKMRKRGVIRTIKAIPDHAKLGKPVNAFVLVSFLPNSDVSQQELGEKIARLGGVQEVHIISGEWDLLLKVRASSMEDLGRIVIDRLRSMKGVSHTATCASFMPVKE